MLVSIQNIYFYWKDFKIQAKNGHIEYNTICLHVSSDILCKSKHDEQFEYLE